VREATRYLESLDATGGTNIAGALDEALKDDVPSGRLGLVLFMTDGEPTVGERSPEAIAQLAARDRGQRRVFTFGVGADLNAALIERLAMEGRGTAQFVRTDESVERAVGIVASRLTNPVVTNVRVSVDGVRLSKRYPSQAADIFAGQDFVILTRYDGSGPSTIRFEGESTTGHVSWTSRVNFPETTRENSFVARLWATQRVGYLSAEKRRGGGSREMDNEIRELGEKYAIPTEFTSYLVVEPGMRIIDAPASVSIKGGVAASPPPTAQAKAFEAARDASRLRAATNIAAADEASRSIGSAAVRQVGTRTFTRADSTWTDTRASGKANRIRIKPFSSAYFKLMEQIPELREIFALGDQIVVAGQAIVIEISPGGVETLSEPDLKRVTAQW
jgi:Ca-activated chloride channel family protein